MYARITVVFALALSLGVVAAVSRYDFRLPFTADVGNLKTHACTAFGATRLTMDIAVGKTCWCRLPPNNPGRDNMLVRA